MSYRHSFFIATVLAVASQVVSSTAHAQTYSNTAPITIPSIGTATPYPSSITVSGGPNSLADLAISLNGFSHTYVSDVNVLLVSPTGQKILLMANCNGNGDASNNTFTFIPNGTVTLPSVNANPLSGVYACSVYSPFDLPAPAPSGPYNTSLAPLLGTNANGTWNLYVFDDSPNDSGTFAGGWSITFIQAPPLPVTTAFTYQGVLSDGGAPINGDANVRFTLCNNPTVSLDFASIAPSITRAFSDLANGQISTSLDFGSAVDTNQALWLNIEVESPPGSGFVALSPRQPITPTPQARVAQFAANAASTPWSGLTGQAAVSTASIGTLWQMLFNNSVTPGFRGGVRLADSGFLEITNNANNPSPNFARLASTGAWSVVSDARLKTDITTAEGNLAAALKLRPVNFRWKGDGAEDFGLIAQEVRAVLPKLVTGDESTQSLTLNYSQLSVVAIGAIQEQQRELEALRTRNQAMQAELEAIKAQLRAMQAPTKP